MPTHGSVAARVRLNKEVNPQYYCPVNPCLWRTYDGRTDTYSPCGKHGLMHPSTPPEKVRV